MKLPAALTAIMMLVTALAPGLAAAQDSDGPLILRVAVQGILRSTNPFYDGVDHWTGLMTEWIYDTPVFISPDTGKIVPYIAVGSANSTGLGTDWSYCEIGNFGYSPKSSWQNSSMKEAIIFYDFENVLWHDGTQMAIRDVLFSYHAAAQDPYCHGDVECLKADNYSADDWLHIEKLWESGTRAALKFTLRTPYWQFFNRTLAVRLLPEHIWTSAASGQNVDGAKIWCDPGYDRNANDTWKLYLAQGYENPNPVGSGMFEWGDFSRDGYVNLTTWRGHFFMDGYKYEDYCLGEWGDSLAEQPYIDGIMFMRCLTASGAMQAMKNRELDYIAWGIPPTYIQELCNSPGISLCQSLPQGFTYLAYNMRKTSFGYLNGDPANGDYGAPLRRAIAHCIDKNTIVQRLLLCTGMSAEGPVSSISPWYNNSIPKYSFDPDETKTILANAGYLVKKADGSTVSGDAAKAAAGNGNWWVRPDGVPIGNSAGGLIQIISPGVSSDPIRAQACLMMAQSLRDAGICAEFYNAWDMEWDRVLERSFDIYVYKCEIDTGPTEFLYDYFHSDNAVVGQNSAGYRNSTAYAAYMGYADSFDEIIEQARSTDNDTVRKQAVFEAQASICYDLPFDALYYQTNYEAYRSDRFTGWASEGGSIFNIRSVRAITGPNPFKLNTQFVSPPSAVVSSSTTQITVFVKDQNGDPVEGAQVWLSVSAGTISPETGLTSPAGKFSALFTAPWANASDPDIVANGTGAIIQIVRAEYTHPSGWEYEDAPSRLAIIRVFPTGRPFLSVSIAADPDIISPDISETGGLGFAYVDVSVKDQDGESVAGAFVALTVSPAVPTVEPDSQTTDMDGLARFRVTAIDYPFNDSSSLEYILKAYAIHPTNDSVRGENECNLWIVDAAPPLEYPPPGFSLSPFEISVTITAIFLAAAALGYFIRRRRKS